MKNTATVVPKPAGKTFAAKMIDKINIALDAIEHSSVPLEGENWIQFSKESLNDAITAVTLNFPDARERDYWSQLVETNKKLADKAFKENGIPEELYAALSVIKWETRTL